MIDCLLGSDLCVWVVSVLCFLRLHAAALKSKDRLFLQAQYTVSVHLDNNYTNFQQMSCSYFLLFWSRGKVEGKEDAEIASLSQSRTHVGPDPEFGLMGVNHVGSYG